MYIQAAEGLGQDVVKANGHERVKLPLCARQGARQRECGLALKVRFRESFADFRREVEKALGRWTTGQRARMLVAKRDDALKAAHKDMLDSRVPNNTFVPLRGKIIYRGPTDGKWRVVDVTFQKELTDGCRNEKGFLVCRTPCMQGFFRDGWFFEPAPGAADPARPNECWYARILAK